MELLEIRHIRDLPIPAYGMWTDAESLDWLHPCHGPLPHQLSAFSCLGGVFTVALWESRLSILTFVSLDDEPDDSVPEVYRLVGPIPRTYCWQIRGGSFYCSGREVKPPRWQGSEEAWRRSTGYQIMGESVRLAIEVPVGIRLDFAVQIADHVGSKNYQSR